MLGKLLISLSLLRCAVAYPSMLENDHLNHLDIRQSGLSPLEISKQESNTGIIKSLDFNAKDQLVDVRKGGPHAFRSPKKTDLRGECPGLNAASNHAYLPRNGVATILETVNGLRDAFGMATDLSAFLAAVAVALSGDFATLQWSIGGAFPSTVPGLSSPQGILGTHNKYEGDASIVRGDAYLNGGNTATFRMDVFKKLYFSAQEYTLHSNRKHNLYVSKLSERTNPHYFSAPFAGLVTPAAHEFVINFMSNHSAERPSGWLNRDVLKTFFSVTGPDSNLVHNIGQERIPENWYRRPLTNTYSAEKNLADTGITALVYPEAVRFGGNTKGVNSFTGVDLSNLTGGVYTSKNIFQGNNLGCFAIQALQAGLPDQLAGLVGDVAAVVNMVSSYADPITKSLRCPKLEKYNQGLFNQYPGYNDTSG